MAVTVVVPGAFREESHADAENDGPEVGDPHGDAPGSGTVEILSAKVDAIGDEDTQRDEELVCADEGSSYVSGCRLGLIHRDEQ